MPITEVKDYVSLAVKGKATLPQRYEIILKQQKAAEKELQIMRERVAHIRKKAAYYESLIEGTEEVDYWACVYNRLMKRMSVQARESA
jgi:trans-aconitate methyltransferase